jgi:hypothetical protein
MTILTPPCVWRAWIKAFQGTPTSVGHALIIIEVEWSCMLDGLACLMVLHGLPKVAGVQRNEEPRDSWPRGQTPHPHFILRWRSCVRSLPGTPTSVPQFLQRFTFVS